ncbi:vacuolar amino acid transporter 2 [Verticillium dahliae VdLs.17]|uniref:Vacuolar amino acid transporter 2 n=1 Tax=Verticillium dahliae (strain VdLs.17 / ATCC MYA-4575 / FGSC 10137) TaxID=498257 RepID=G2XA19_VERDV|nr:vacuolar amino acid transporter 2 [Verticillium dahliae VdLs.17]EGY15758.1 vacuolar amino acid transporter 2 [Verticillium dahliae VdLs.17]KAF3343634.1 Transcriptional activator HAP5 [Verticillium dahliae VDG2]
MPQARTHGASTGEDHASSEEDLGLLADDPLADTNAKSPRTSNRVRFDLTPSIREAPAPSSSHGASSFDMEEPPGYFEQHGHGDDQHHPLLTDIEAPSVALANSPWAEDEDVHDWAEQQRQRPKSGLRMAFMNMANSIIGAGIIGQPYAFKQAGLLAGVVLLVGLTFVVDWTICLIVINSKLSGSDSFQGTVQHCFGRPGLIAISVAQWAFAFGGMVAFGVIVGDSIPHVFLAIWPDLRETPVLWLLANRQFVIAVFIMGVSFPLTLYRDISKVPMSLLPSSITSRARVANHEQLAKASTLALVSMGVIVVTVVVQGLLTPRSERGSFTPALLTINGGIFEAIGVISFAFVCHHNSLLIYGSLKTPTIDRFSRVTHYSTGISMVFCLLMALAGFLTFGDKTLGNVLNNFPADNVMVTIARLCFGLNMLTTLPLEAFVCREVMFNYFYPGEPFNLKLHLIFSTALVGSATVISLTTCDVGVVFELVGATSACAMAYILPPLCYIKLTTRSWRTYLAMAIVVFGTIVMCISLVQAVGKMISNESGAAQCM